MMVICPYLSAQLGTGAVPLLSQLCCNRPDKGKAIIGDGWNFFFFLIKEKDKCVVF